ncbi:hypothetical protein D9M71_473490 [compost metagenome]
MAGELEGIGQQVAGDLPHAQRVADDLAGQIGRDQAGQLDPGRGILRQQAGGFLDQAGEVEGRLLQFELAGVEL